MRLKKGRDLNYTVANSHFGNHLNTNTMKLLNVSIDCYAVKQILRKKEHLRVLDRYVGGRRDLKSRKRTPTLSGLLLKDLFTMSLPSRVHCV